MHHKNPHFTHFFHRSWDAEIIEYYIYNFLRQIGGTLLAVFVPIYLYTDVGYSLFEIMVFFVINQVFFIFSIPFSGKIIEKIGVKHALLLNLPALASFAYLLRFLEGDFWGEIGLIIVILAIRAIPKSPKESADIIFVSRHVMKNKKKEGSAIASLRIVMIFASLASPLLGGFVSAIFGFDAFFTAAVIILLFAAIPLILTKDEYFKLKKRPLDLLRFTARKMPKNFRIAEFGRWMADSVIWLLWPLFIYIVLSDVSEVGLIVSASGIIAIIVNYYVGKKMDKNSPKKLLSRMTKVASGIFFLRAAFPTPLMLITTDAINRIVSPLLMLPYQKYYYGFMKSNENLIEASVAANLILEIPYLVSFSLLAIYFGIIEYLDLPITYLTFVIPFVFFGFFILLMNRISKIKID